MDFRAAFAGGLLFAVLAGPIPSANADADPGADERCPPQVPVEPGRRSPTIDPAPFVAVPCNPEALPPPRAAESGNSTPVPDRWRLQSMLGAREDLLDPYHGNNWLKGDRPIFGDDWFFALLAVSDTTVEPRRFPVPVGGPVSEDPGALDTFGNGTQWAFAENLILETVLYRGDTVFQPPDWEFRFTPVINYNYAHVEERGLLYADPGRGTTRSDAAVGIQALFVDRHLRNVSDRFDFDSLRVGIQPFTADFRGFLFQDAPFGVRLFGTRDNNRWQYNLAWLRRIDKDTNSGLNDVLRRGLAALRDDDVFIGNLYRQDFPVPGFTSQVVAAWNRNREDRSSVYDDNGFLQRPASIGLERRRRYDVTYLGYNGDGHFKRWNLSTSLYAALGRENRSVFRDASSRIRAGFAAAEISRDFDWIRARASVAWASGDDDPYDRRSTGYDAIFENPLFAGADTSFWIRQAVPLIGGGRVALAGRNGLLTSLRSSKDFGQSNFVNPGLRLAGIGADLDLTPTLRLSANLNQLWFEKTAVLEAARAQADVGRNIGQDLSLAVTWRPLAIQNLVLRVSAAALRPARGFRDLYRDTTPYSVLANLVLSY
jgi:hypothetical protein